MGHILRVARTRLVRPKILAKDLDLPPDLGWGEPCSLFHNLFHELFHELRGNSAFQFTKRLGVSLSARLSLSPGGHRTGAVPSLDRIDILG